MVCTFQTFIDMSLLTRTCLTKEEEMRRKILINAKINNNVSNKNKKQNLAKVLSNKSYMYRRARCNNC